MAAAPPVWRKEWGLPSGAVGMVYSPGMPSFALLGLFACAGGSGTDADSGEATTCAPLSLSSVQEWDQDALLGGGAPPEFGGNAGVGLGDVDGDGWLDLIAVTPEGSLGLLNDGSGDLLEGFAVPAATGIALGDLDGDGDLDAWLGQMSGTPDLIWTNQGQGVFTETPLADGLGESTSGSLADVDGDGDLDLFVARYAAQLDIDAVLEGTLTGGGNALYRNDGGTWTWQPDALPADVVDDLTFMGQWLDADQDGDLDLYLANDFGPFLGRNRLLLNDGLGVFEADDACACDLSMFAMGATVGDTNADGHPDLFLTDLAGPDLLLSVGDGTFYEAAAVSGAAVPLDEAHLASWGTVYADLDRSGQEDLALVFGPLFPHGDPDGLTVLGSEYQDWTDAAEQRDVLLLADGAGGFTEASSSSGFEHEGMGRAVAVGDLDQDGRPDLVTAGLWFVRNWRTSGAVRAE